ncbi:MAG: pilus assembly protein N-terminal domain-containing protein, partial [Halobacteriovoraceae bacterium]|nr:pilus assembly protein N-terminal domain-containing protein [Halobacteriovoraceae bacterium]
MSYALSKWILNLGVLPLLRSCALRFLPIFPRLLQRLLYVARFLETIYPPSLWSKVFILFLLSFVKISLYAQSSTSHSAIILALGGHREIPVSNLQKYTVGNPQIVSYKLRFSPKRILIKGKKPGFTELVVWSNKRKSVYPIYVLSRNHQLPILPMGQALQSLGLKTEFLGQTLVVQGILKEVDSYLFLKKLQKTHGEQLYLRGSLAPILRNHIIGEVYFHFFNENLDQIECHQQNFDIICYYPQSRPPGNGPMQHLIEHWGVK